MGIPKRSFTSLREIAVNGATVWKGTFSGAATGVSWVGEDSEYVKFKVAPGEWKFVATGVLPVTSPKPPAQPVAKPRPLDKKDWTASASVPDGTFAFSGKQIPIDVSAANAIDGDHWTGWRDMTQLQHPGQWFQLDMKRARNFDTIVLNNTWALWDSPEKYSVSVSNDGTSWSDPIATGSGQLGITTIQFANQNARYVRITQTGTSAKYHWSIYEIDVCKR